MHLAQNTLVGVLWALLLPWAACVAGDSNGRAVGVTPFLACVYCVNLAFSGGEGIVLEVQTHVCTKSASLTCRGHLKGCSEGASEGVLSCTIKGKFLPKWLD
jgi:hypothetical protein